MPEGAPDIEVIFRAMLKQESDREVGGKTDQRDQHHPSAGDLNRRHEPLDTHERDADGGEDQDEGIEKGCHDAGSMIAESSRVGGRLGCQDVGIECQEKGALVDEVVSSVPDQADAVRQEAADELRDDDDRIEGEGDPQSGTKFMIGVRDHCFECLTGFGEGQAVGRLLLR